MSKFYTSSTPHFSVVVTFIHLHLLENTYSLVEKNHTHIIGEDLSNSLSLYMTRSFPVPPDLDIHTPCLNFKTAGRL